MIKRICIGNLYAHTKTYKNIQKHRHTVGQHSRFPSHLLAHFPPRQVRERSPRTGVLLWDMNHRHFASLAPAYVPTKRSLTLSDLFIWVSQQTAETFSSYVDWSKLSLYSHKGRWLLVFIPIYLIRVSFYSYKRGWLSNH